MFYHVTHRKNLAKIKRAGLKAEYATGVKRVWLCNRPKLRWALKHVAEWHGWDPAKMVVLCVDAPRAWASRWRWGVYTCQRDIPATAVHRTCSDAPAS